MRYAPLVALSVVLFASGSALAQEALGAIEVKAEDSDRTITIACSDPAEPSLKEVDEVLKINDPTQSKGLRDKLMAAAAEACAQKVPKILVTRSATGSLTWKAM
ncbi:hypothetical protein [Noviluteimonas gilva]|uniref:Uncharacterized protein n=1 Tax=Noviluteimonas gilva TaxID=2682097 RepID=A0A7C9M553_9GAMM|nr:hypothetical protein [Lysobacter gilvus]MUV15486.1 hypothetical protein [Lysobacter gilvus]